VTAGVCGPAVGGGGGGGGGDDVVVVGGGGGGGGGGVVTGTVVVGVVVTVGVGFVRAAALAFGAVVRATAATGATEATTFGTTVAAPCGRGVRRGGLGAAGACTTLRVGPGPSAIPTGAAGLASKRGMSAPPATAIASRSAAITRSLRLMLFPSPADNIP
jgi:hypothetical protein